MTNSTASNSTEEPELNTLQEVEDVLWLYFGTIVLVVGTVGHLLTIIVTLSSSSSRRHSSSVYISALALSGLLILYTSLLSFLISWHTAWEVDVKNTSSLACKLHTGFSYFSLQYFAWLQATIAVDRMLSVVKPQWYSISCQWRPAIITVFVELIVCLLVNIVYVYVMVGLDRDGFCVSINKALWNVYKYADFVSFSIIPAAILLICNGIIVYKFARMSKLTTIRRRSITITLMVVNVVFLVTTLPISLIYQVDWTMYDYDVISLVFAIFSLFQYTGSASTFLIYCLCASKFRKRLKSIFAKLTCPKPSATLTAEEMI